MTSYVSQLIDNYNDLFINRRDPRVDGWLFTSSPWPTLFLCIGYVYLVKVVGPWLMRGRKPFELRYVLVAYNAFQVVFSAWIFYELGQGGWFGKYSFRCQPVDYSNDPTAVRMVHASWWYYFSKFTEFFDTFFFVLRKKFEHISTLHVVHHGVMPMSVWFGLKFTPGGHSTFFGLLNTFVHIIMYLYYMLAAMGPQYHKYLWWKKYLTTLQMVQFVLIFTHAFQLAFSSCEYPRSFMWWIGGHAVLFFFLFTDFYRSAYMKRGRSLKIPVASITSLIPCMIHEKLSESSSNGHISNEKATMNGHANGFPGSFTDITSPIANGIKKRSHYDSNGTVRNGAGVPNGVANGVQLCNGYSNGIAGSAKVTNGHANGDIWKDRVYSKRGKIEEKSD